MKKLRWATLVGTLGSLPSIAWSQSLNLDTGTASTAPTAGYAGAAGSPGFWNNYIGNDSSPFPLLDLGGHTSSVTFSMNLPFGAASYAHPTLSGGDALLLEDYFDLHSTRADFTLAGLQEGHYTVVTYAWAPDNPNIQISVDVNGVGAQLIGGPWPGSHTLGTTYARHEVDIQKDEPLDIFVRGIPSNGTLNGLQLKYRPGFADAGEADSGAPDAELADAGDLDASATDLGAEVDGSALDAGGLPDAGAPLDAGARADASSADVGAVTDAAAPVDAGGAADGGLNRPDAGASRDAANGDGEAAGCGCQETRSSNSGAALGGLTGLAWLARRPRRGR